MNIALSTQLNECKSAYKTQQVNQNPFKQNVLSFQGDSFQRTEEVDYNKISKKVLNELNTEKPVNPWLHSLFVVLPKAELHSHLRGSRPTRILKEMFLARGISDKEATTKSMVHSRFENLSDFVTSYEKVTQNCKDPEQLKLATYIICKKAAEDNVRYLPLRIGLAGESNSPEEILNAVKEGIKLCQDEIQDKNFAPKVKVIVGAKRHGHKGDSTEKIVKAAMEEVKLAVKLRESDPDKTIVGFDICGDEIHHKIDDFAPVIKYAKDNDLPVTIHAGETDHSEELTGAESVEHALHLGADRIGHGLHALDDEELTQELKEKGTILEVPPTSNVAIGNATWKEHPIRKMLDKGLKVAICTDDPGLLHTKISKELERLYKHGVIQDWNEIKEIILNGARGSFLPKEEKEELVQEFEEELKAIEETPQFKSVIDQYLTPAKQFVSFAGKKLNLYKNTPNN